jgi:hypothetical protein
VSRLPGVLSARGAIFPTPRPIRRTQTNEAPAISSAGVLSLSSLCGLRVYRLLVAQQSPHPACDDGAERARCWVARRGCLSIQYAQKQSPTSVRRADIGASCRSNVEGQLVDRPCFQSSTLEAKFALYVKSPPNDPVCPHVLPGLSDPLTKSKGRLPDKEGPDPEITH